MQLMNMGTISAIKFQRLCLHYSQEAQCALSMRSDNKSHSSCNRKESAAFSTISPNEFKICSILREIAEKAWPSLTSGLDSKKLPFIEIMTCQPTFP